MKKVEVVGTRIQWGGVEVEGVCRLSGLGGSILKAKPGGGAASDTGD